MASEVIKYADHVCFESAADIITMTSAVRNHAKSMSRWRAQTSRSGGDFSNLGSHQSNFNCHILNSWHRHRHTCVWESYGTKRISQVQALINVPTESLWLRQRRLFARLRAQVLIWLGWSDEVTQLGSGTYSRSPWENCPKLGANQREFRKTTFDGLKAENRLLLLGSQRRQVLMRIMVARTGGPHQQHTQLCGSFANCFAIE